MQEWIVGSQDAGSKLIAFLARQFNSQYSARQLKRAIENNLCQINGRTERFASVLLGLGDKITLRLEEAVSFSSSSLTVDLKSILFEDKHLLIYNKPKAINCDADGILKLLQPYCPSLQLVHRLDRDTTGVLLLAKDEKSSQFLLGQFKKATVHKCYRAIADGILKEKDGVIDNFLGKKKIYQGQTIWGAVTSGGVHAYTRWKRLKTGNRATLLHCFPETGRTHQIRVHLSEIGHPILGDYQYAKKFCCPYRPLRYLLHAEKISFVHPESKQILSIEASLPEDFLTAQNQLFGMISSKKND